MIQFFSNALSSLLILAELRFRRNSTICAFVCSFVTNVFLLSGSFTFHGLLTTNLFFADHSQNKAPRKGASNHSPASQKSSNSFPSLIGIYYARNTDDIFSDLVRLDLHQIGRQLRHFAKLIPEQSS